MRGVLDQRGGPLVVARRQRVIHGGDLHAVVGIPQACTRVQQLERRGRLLFKLAAQKRGE